jgi:uroporphyrinogen III methyltransferase / synthase
LRAPERPKGAFAEGTQRQPGRVHLVGAGPGDPGLLTARALELIAGADTILYDRLIPKQALDGAREDAELLFVGKQGGGDSVPQEHTQALMIARAREGRTVVRLKGGDPFVFGRGGEEALAMRQEGIDYEIVPGVTAGVAAAAYAGIPVTHRGMSTAVALVTGHTQARAGNHQVHPPDTGAAGPPDTEATTHPLDTEATDQDSDEGEPQLDWGALAVFPGTLVFYMGVRELERIAAALIQAGRRASQPVALVERGTLPEQRTVTGTLATIAEVARREEVRAPAIAIVGEVVGLAESLTWLPPRPLAGRTVAVTRARAQASDLARRLEHLGADVVEAPTIRTCALGGGPLDPTPYDLVCLTSPNGVHCLFERLDDGIHPPGDARSLAHARVAAIGPGTAHALASHGITADVLPERFVAESLVQALAGVDARRVLVARAREARDVLPDALRERGAEVDVVALYETLAEPLSESALSRARSADYITFTSSSTVRYFLEAGGTPSPTTRIASIGPVTSATLREHGLEPHVEAERHDVDGLVEALVADAADPTRG